MRLQSQSRLHCLTISTPVSGACMCVQLCVRANCATTRRKSLQTSTLPLHSDEGTAETTTRTLTPLTAVIARAQRSISSCSGSASSSTAALRAAPVKQLSVGILDKITTMCLLAVRNSAPRVPFAPPWPILDSSRTWAKRMAGVCTAVGIVWLRCRHQLQPSSPLRWHMTVTDSDDNALLLSAVPRKYPTLATR